MRCYIFNTEFDMLLAFNKKTVPIFKTKKNILWQLFLIFFRSSINTMFSTLIGYWSIWIVLSMLPDIFLSIFPRIDHWVVERLAIAFLKSIRNQWVFSTEAMTQKMVRSQSFWFDGIDRYIYVNDRLLTIDSASTKAFFVWCPLKMALIIILTDFTSRSQLPPMCGEARGIKSVKSFAVNI